MCDVGLSDVEDDTATAVKARFATLLAAAMRPDVSLAEVPAPGSRVAPYGFAVEAELLPQSRSQVVVDAEPLATGRFIVLHDPAGNEEWGGSWRIVIMASAGVDAVMGRDPLLAEVTWSWLIDALDARDAHYVAERGTVTATASRTFSAYSRGGERTGSGDADLCEVELRCSWSPSDSTQLPDHLTAFCDLLGALAGVPSPESGVAPLRGLISPSPERTLRR